jgi:hypothetical protein
MRSNKNWKRYAMAPEEVQRPAYRYDGGFYMIFSNGYDLIPLWRAIRRATENGDLGHYSAINDNNEIICVHNSDASDEREKRRVRRALRELGVDYPINYKSQAEANHKIEKNGKYIPVINYEESDDDFDPSEDQMETSDEDVSTSEDESDDEEDEEVESSDEDYLPEYK